MSLLNTIITGKIKKPVKVLLYGVEGVGKSSWAINAPNPVYIGAEDNDELDIKRFPTCTEFADVTNQLKALLEDSRDFKSVVIDTVDSVETLAINRIKRDSGKQLNQAYGGYGNGPDRLAYDMGVMLKLLDRLRDEKGMAIILLAHANKVKFENPITLSSYDTWELKLHKKVTPIFVEWVQSLLFANTAAYKTKDEKFAVGAGERQVFTENRPAYRAKNRFNLPEQIELEWKEFSDGVDAFYSDKDLQKKIAELNTEIKQLKSKIEDKDLSAKINGAFKTAENNPKKLEAIKNRLLQIIEEK